MEYLTNTSFSALAPTPGISIRCPACRKMGILELVPGVPDVHFNVTVLGAGPRKCPNPECECFIFIIYRLDESRSVIRSYPSERVDFDSSNIPLQITKTLEEALTCHAEGCFTAAAIMIRRTLEELCEDKKATGKNLKDRIASLKTSVILPPELFDALDELRLLGNDAAHIEAKTFDNIGKDEIDAGLLLTKEILKAVYQLDSLVAQLRALKK
jgi:hypothetical protein